MHLRAWCSPASRSARASPGQSWLTTTPQSINLSLTWCTAVGAHLASLDFPGHRWNKIYRFQKCVQYWSYLACFPPTIDACDFNAAPNVRKPATSSPALPVLTLLFFFCGVFFLTSTKILRFLKRIRFFRRPLTLSDYLILGVPTNIFPDHPSPVSVSRRRGWE